jgi:hypothetical protein
VKGSIVECGVYHGGGLMTYAQLSAALEPINYNRRIIGFDTFSGNASYSNRDKPTQSSADLSQPAYAVDVQEELNQIISVYDINRFLGHIPKIELVRGDICETIPTYLEENPHLLVSLVELSVNLYEPTKVAMKTLLPRMPCGAVMVINTLNEGVFPGVTLALLEELDVRHSAVQSVPYCPNLSYCVL